MTTLISWVGADQRGPASIRLAADSRISWSLSGSEQKKWDFGKKLFASHSGPEIVGYCGDVLHDPRREISRFSMPRGPQREC